MTTALTEDQLNALAATLAETLQRKSKVFRGADAEQITQGCYKFTVFENSSSLLSGSVLLQVNGVTYNSSNDQHDSSMGVDFFIDDKHVFFRDNRCGGTMTSLRPEDVINISYHEVN